MKSLRTYIIAGSAAIALTVFILFAFAVKFLFENNVKENAQRTAAGISRQVFHSMFQIMRMGWAAKTCWLS